VQQKLQYIAHRVSTRESLIVRNLAARWSERQPRYGKNKQTLQDDHDQAGIIAEFNIVISCTKPRNSSEWLIIGCRQEAVMTRSSNQDIPVMFCARNTWNEILSERAFCKTHLGHAPVGEGRMCFCPNFDRAANAERTQDAFQGNF
jgi:hypothetical protein